jgi:predicted metal-dependent peptidase
MSTLKGPEKGWIALQQARGYVKQKFPYFYPTMLGFIPTHVRDIGTMFVTKSMVLGIDMEWYATLSAEVAGGCLCHEVMHILRDYFRRVIHFPDGELAGRAFDIPINDDLRAAGVQLPDWVIYSDTYKLPKGLSGEKYYELLGGVQFPHHPMIGNGRCGSCDGYTLDMTKVEDPGRTPMDVLHFRKQGIQAIKDALAKGNYGRGQAPGSLIELLEYDGSEKAVVPWQQVMGSSMYRSFGRIVHGHSDYSLRRPAKRSYAVGILRPGLVGYEPNICFIEDNSGSMGSVQIRENRIEFCNCLKILGVTDVWVIRSDAGVHGRPVRMTVQQLREMPALGRGGTDFCPAIEAAMSIRPAPDLVCYSTDGDGFAPDYPPRGTEFIWLLAPGPWTRSPCNWGTQILTTNDEDERKEYQLLA